MLRMSVLVVVNIDFHNCFHFVYLVMTIEFESGKELTLTKKKHIPKTDNSFE